MMRNNHIHAWKHTVTTPSRPVLHAHSYLCLFLTRFSVSYAHNVPRIVRLHAISFSKNSELFLSNFDGLFLLKFLSNWLQTLAHYP